MTHLRKMMLEELERRNNAQNPGHRVNECKLVSTVTIRLEHQVVAHGGKYALANSLPAEPDSSLARAFSF
jgi:hypothetical protein